MYRTLLAILVAVSTVAFAQFASAADLPSKAAPMAPAPIAPSWTGFYIGGNLGYGWTDNRSTTVSANDPATQVFLAAVNSNVPPNSKSNGILGGLQLGYNYQFAPSWLVGIETDFQASSLNDTASGSFRLGGVPFSTAAHQDINWFGTVRGRLGFLITPSWLVYGTGGFAYGRVEESYSTANVSPNVSITVLAPPGFTCAAGAVCAAGSKTDTRGGWTAGGGFEYLLPNIRILNQPTTVKLEYLYVNLGSQDVVVPTTNPAASFTAHSGDVVFNVVRAGVNVKF
jgi:outer membrane immunogenic protein